MTPPVGTTDRPSTRTARTDAPRRTPRADGVRPYRVPAVRPSPLSPRLGGPRDLVRPRPVPDRLPEAGSRRRMGFVTVLVLLAMVVFAGRLVYVQGLHGASVAEEARSSRLTTVPILGMRGQITDADGIALATSVERYDVSVNQKRIPLFRGSDGVPDGAVGVARLLAPVLGMDEAELGGMLVGDRGFKYLRKGVVPEVARQIRALHIDGIEVDQVADRVYPNGSLAGNVIGFVNSEGVGLEGLERSLDDRLTGTPGEETFERGAGGQPIPGGYSQDTPAVAGDSVQLTLRSDIQYRAQEALDAQVAATGSDSGSLVALVPSTGEILALADSGSTDPNHPGDSAGGSLASSVSDVFEPGSTGKVVTMAAALETGVVTPTTQFEVPYQYTTENGQTFKDSHEHPVERLTTTGILAESSNAGTVMLGQHIPQQTRYDYLSKFGFGTRTGIELPGESPGILHPADQWDGRSKYAVLFGQAVSVTAVQATQVFATIANDGVRVQPHIIKGWTDPDGTYTPAPEPARTQVVSPETARTVLTMMESVVDDGTGGNASIPGYRVAGKTGTAQNWVNGQQGITASFIGVAPADDPQVAVAVILHNPKTSVYGGDVAAPVFSDVTGYILGELGVPPSGAPATLFPTTW